MKSIGRAVSGTFFCLAVVSLAAALLHSQKNPSVLVGQLASPARTPRTQMLAGVFRVADNDFGRLSTVRGKKSAGASVGWRERDERELTRESRRAEGYEEREIGRKGRRARARALEPSVVVNIRQDAMDADRGRASTASTAATATVPRAVKRSSSASHSMPADPSVVEEIERGGRDADSDRSGARASFSLPKEEEAKRLRQSRGSSPLPSEPNVVMNIRREGKSADFDQNAKALIEQTADKKRRVSLASTSSSFGDNEHPDAREEYDISKAREYKLTEPDEDFLEKNAKLVAEAQKEYALEEGVRLTAGVGVPKAGGKWGGGLEEFGVDIKGRSIKTSGYAWMP